MDIYFVYYLALAVNTLIGVLLCVWLWVKAGNQAGMRPLAVFCLGVGIWGAGHFFLRFTPAAAILGQGILNLAPMVAMLFLHFVLRFTRHVWVRSLAWGYAGALLISLAASVSEAGALKPWLGFPRYFVLDTPAAWIPTGFVIIAGIAAYSILFRASRSAAQKRRRQITAIFSAGLWGFFCAAGHLAPSLGINVFPYSMLLFPSYALMLVYGILRYEIMAVNHWANRILAWLALSAGLLLSVSLLITAFAYVGFQQFADVPLWQIWLFSLVVLLLALALEHPARRLASRLIFPGTQLETFFVLEKWRKTLEEAHGWEMLQQRAGQLLLSQLRQPVQILLAPLFSKEKTESERAAQSAGTRFKEKTESERAAQSAGTRFKEKTESERAAQSAGT
ncbi:MAG: hypothetical protein GY862_24960, partial [Gammaproteobacteria bacterium]|nr:hypothetical protein [Gammaproteobacteria bacterium]